MGSYPPRGDSATISNTSGDPAITQENLDTVVGSIAVDTAKNGAVDWFDSDLSFDSILSSSNNAATCRCDFIFTGNNAQISFTFDGTNFAFLSEGDLLIEDSLYTFTFGAEFGNSFNIRSSATITIKKCTVVLEGKQDIT